MTELKKGPFDLFGKLSGKKVDEHIDVFRPFSKGRDPALHFQRGLGWFHKLGLKNSTAQVFAGSASAPLHDDIRQALTELIDMRWPGVETELSPQDAVEFRRLCRSDSPDFILNLPDYCALFTYTMFRGEKPENILVV